MLTNLFYLILLILGFPVGILLSKLCKDEIKNWRKRLMGICLIAFLAIIFMVFIPAKFYPYKTPAIISLFFIIIICLIIIWKSY